MAVEWNATHAEAYVLEASFHEVTECSLEYSLSGLADESPLYWMIGIRWPASFGLEEDWGWGFASPVGSAQVAGTGTGTTIPGLTWTTVGSQPFSLRPADDLVVVVAQFTPDGDADQVSFVCDGPAQVRELQGRSPVILSPAASNGGAAAQGAETFLAEYTRSFTASSPVLVFGCYCPGQDPIGFHDVALDLPSNRSDLHFEGTDPESVLIHAAPGSGSISLTSASLRGRLLLAYVEYQPRPGHSEASDLA